MIESTKKEHFVRASLSLNVFPMVFYKRVVWAITDQRLSALHVHMPSLAHAWSFLQRWLVVPGYDCLWLCLCMYVQLSLCAYAFLSPQMMLSSRILCVCICLCSDYIVIGTQQGTINCASLLAGLGGSGNPRRKWEEMGEREREREREKCCFCLQNDLKEPLKSKKCIYCLSKSLVYSIYRNYQKKIEHTL